MPVPPPAVRRAAADGLAMRAEYGRGGTEAPAAKRGNPGYPSAGKIAWYLWGGDAGRAWARRELAAIEAD